MADEFQKRQIAFKTRISQIINSQYFKEEGMQPNYVLINNKKVSRVNIIGVVLSKTVEESNTIHQNIILDDGSGKIALRIFDDTQIKADIGDFVLVIGRPREFGSDKYVVPEIVKKIDQRWASIRKKEFETESFVCEQIGQTIEKTEMNTETINAPATTTKAVNPTISTHSEQSGTKIVVEKEQPDKSSYDKILDIIKETDSGTGVSFEAVIEKFGSSDAEKIIKRLLELGELFEIRPGVLKILE